MLSSSKVIWKKRCWLPDRDLPFLRGPRDAGVRIVLDALTRSPAPRRDNCSLIRAAWSCGKAGGPFPQSLTMCGSRRVAEAGEEKWRGCAWDGAPETFRSHAGEGTQSPHRHKLTGDSLEIDQGKNPQSPRDSFTRSSRQPGTASKPAGAAVPMPQLSGAKRVNSALWELGGGRGATGWKCGQLRAGPRRDTCKWSFKRRRSWERSCPFPASYLPPGLSY